MACCRPRRRSATHWPPRSCARASGAARCPTVLRRLPVDQVGLKPFDLVGLRSAARAVRSTSHRRRSQCPDSATEELPNLCRPGGRHRRRGHGLIMLMGKGGVGKTTLAAAVAVELARRGLAVHLTHLRPCGPSVRDAGGPARPTERQPHRSARRDRALPPAGAGDARAKLDAQGRALLEEDLRSPCTEEIAVFQAFSRIIREAGTSSS